MNLTDWMSTDDALQEQAQETTDEVEEKKMPTNDELPGACRVQSPSSILTHNQCPRKYYYRYIEKLPGGRSIHLVRGVVAHKVLEDIFAMDFSKVPDESFFGSLKIVLQEAFRKEWYASAKELAELELSPEQLEEYRMETGVMIDNFFHYIYERMQPMLETMTHAQAWAQLTPEAEVLMKSPTHVVRGYIDAIEKIDGKISIIDYKTSKKFEITQEYHLQLGIYAMMHEEVRGQLPHEVGVFFLKHGKDIRIPVTNELVNHAKAKCEQIQLHTRTTDKQDYPKKESPLCKWRTGQCEYYELCFTGMNVEEYREKIALKR